MLVSVPVKGNDLLREMIESGVIKYGKEFEESMELVVGT